jgi:hypothetical protein
MAVKKQDELAAIDKQYTKLFNEEIKKLKDIGVDEQSIENFTQWVMENPINVSDIDPDFRIQEQFLNLRKVTWDKIRTLIVGEYGKAEYDPVYDHIVEKTSQLIKMVLTGLFDSLLTTIEELKPMYEYKKGRNTQQLAIAIIIRGLEFDYVERAYFEFIKILYKAIIKYFLYNKTFKLEQPLEQHYLNFLQLYRPKIEHCSERLEREFDSWLYDWDNIGEISQIYLDTDDYQEFNKILAKTYAGDLI